MAEYNPIWKDIDVPIEGGSFSVYRTEADGSETLIYTGKSVMKPGAGIQYANVRVNGIFHDHLNFPSLPDFADIPEGNFVDIAFATHFRVTDENVETSPERFAGDVMNDWSYDYGYDAAKNGLSVPINGRISPGQYLVYSVADAAMINVTLRYKDGHSETLKPVGNGADFNADFNADFLITDRYAEPAKTGMVLMDMSSYPDLASVSIRIVSPDGTGRTEEFRVADTCTRYALYYTNAYGGWDTFLPEGLCTRTDELTRHTVQRDYSNILIRNRGTVNYCNEIVRKWTLQTGWLSDEASLKMHHLLNSTDIYLFDIQTGQTIPVVFTNTETEYKTYRNSGRKLVSYEIEAQLAQDRERR